MAIMNPQTAFETLKISSFGGIRDHAGLTSENAYDMRNFRILSDGSLEKRCGFSKRYSLGGAVRGIWEGTLSGETYFFAVAGAQIYRLGPDDTSPQAIYTLPTTAGNVSFAFYRENLYLLDGQTLLIFRASSQSFTVAEGYTPLYGQNWHPTELGEINEPLNLIQNKIRIHYLNTNGSTVFNLPFTTEKISSVKINGSSTTLYSFTPYTSSFTIPSSLATVGSVEVTATPDSIFSRRATVLEAANAVVYQTPHHQVFMSFGDSLGYSIYRSAVVTDEMLDACLLSCASADPLYIPKDHAFSVGSTQHPVRALCQYEDQMLVFNDENVWTIRYTGNETEDAEILPLRSGLGCASEKGVGMCGEFPVAISESGIVQLEFSSGNSDFCQTELISGEIEKRFDSTFLTRAILFWHRAKNELWLRDPLDTEGLVWIRDMERKLWFSFDGIHANRFFETDGSVGFSTDDGNIFVFDETLDTDNGVAVSAYYQSHFLGFSKPEFAKRAIRLSLCSQTKGSTVTALVETERAEKSFALNGKNSDAPSFFDRRLAIGRFRFLRFRLSADGAARCRILLFSLAANQ